MNQTKLQHTSLGLFDAGAIIHDHYKMLHWPTLLEIKREIDNLVRRKEKESLDDSDALLAARLKIEWEAEANSVVEGQSGCGE